MELVRILRELSRRKRLVALVLVGSLTVGLLLAFKPGVPPQSRQYDVALAASNILVDNRHSQLAATRGSGAGLPTLSARANLLANLMTSGRLKEAIAKRAGLTPSELTVVLPANPASAEQAKVSQSVPDAKAKTLSVSVEEGLPIIDVAAQAPSVDTARLLAGGAVVALRQYLASVSASQDIGAARQLAVRQFGPPAVGLATRGLPRSTALIVALGLALLGCGAIVGGSWFVRMWRQLGEAESRGRGGGEDLAAVSPAPAGPAALSTNGTAEGERRPDIPAAGYWGG